MSEREPLISKEDCIKSFGRNYSALRRRQLNQPHQHDSETHGTTQQSTEDKTSASSELRIVLLGKTGSGKSSTGNTILGPEYSKYFMKAVSPVSVTNSCERKEVQMGGRVISVIDTPGLFDTTMSTQKMKEELVKCVFMSVPGPHVFLLVIHLGVRFTDEEKNTVKWIQMNFGEEAACYTIVLFTHADALDGKPLDKYIRESNHLQALVHACDGRFHSFNNMDMDNRYQVIELLKKIEMMVKENGGQHYTDQMYQEAQRRILAKEQFWSEKPRIVLLGKTGSGKTRAVETIVGRESSQVSELNTATETSKKQEGSVAGKSMTIIDTPGLIDAPEKNMKYEVEQVVLLSVPGPHVFLLVIKLDTRCTDEEETTEKWIQKNIGKDAVCHTIVLFTHADHLRGKSLDQYIGERRFLQSLVNSCDGRFISFNNQDRSNHNQVTELLERIENMAEKNGWRYYTNEIFQKIIKRKIFFENAKKKLKNAAIAAVPVCTGSIAAGVTVALTESVIAPVLIFVGVVGVCGLVVFGLNELFHKSD